MIADEAAFWYSDEFSANTDTEILNAVRPGLATTGGPLIIASSPYARRDVTGLPHLSHIHRDFVAIIFSPGLCRSMVIC